MAALDLDEFDRRLLAALQRDNRQKRFDTVVVMSRVKFETATPIKD